MHDHRIVEPQCGVPPSGCCGVAGEIAVSVCSRSHRSPSPSIRPRRRADSRATKNASTPLQRRICSRICATEGSANAEEEAPESQWRMQEHSRLMLGWWCLSARSQTCRVGSSRPQIPRCRAALAQPSEPPCSAASTAFTQAVSAAYTPRRIRRSCPRCTRASRTRRELVARSSLRVQISIDDRNGETPWTRRSHGVSNPRFRSCAREEPRLRRRRGGQGAYPKRPET